MTKQTQSRYVLKEQIGSGEFAKVYAADDTRLGRPVAVKQLHGQYLGDQKTLEKYWGEAQMLVELEHPNILTIYDLAKSRGSLVLELMKGNLTEIYGSRPMPVREVRQTLLQVARGLQCLHRNEIVHGDIRPANLMLSRQGIVKIGDFGLARRANDEDGSLLKGTTKHMAPELVSEDFGSVGPASDLYSLGFSALELMIGPEFDSLFPDLIAFGRDKQMAWMMWHCSADRKLPPINQILAGVPADLAAILQKLTSKNQSDRYTSATELISDLTKGAKPVGDSLKEEELAKAAAAKALKRKRRIQAVCACVASVVISGILLWVTREKPAPPVAVAPPPIRGVVKNVLPHVDKFVVSIGNDWKELSVKKADNIVLNRKKRQLRDLETGDRVIVRTVLDSPTTKHREIVAFRPETHKGIVADLNSEDSRIFVMVNEGTDIGTTFELITSPETEVILNREKSKTVNSLKKNDRVVIDISDDETGMLALKIDATRLLEVNGRIRKLEPKNGTVTIAQGINKEEPDLVTLPIDSNCVFTLNGLAAVDEKLLDVASIQVGDRVSVLHDVKIRHVDAFRKFGDSGRITAIAYDDNTIRLKSRSATKTKSYQIDAETEVLLNGISTDFESLRAGDNAQLVHDSPDEDSPTLVSLNATRPSNSNRWAILIGNDSFGSSSNRFNPTALADLEAIRHQMLTKFAIPEGQISVFENEGRVRIQNEIPSILKRTESNDEIYVYISTAGFKEKQRAAYLATKNFNPQAMDSSGIGLTWIIDQLDNSPARKKLLLLDCHHVNNSPENVTAAEMVELAIGNQRGGYPRSTFVMTNCQAGESPSIGVEESGTGIFGTCVANAFSGAADLERDSKVEVTELTTFVKNRVIAMATDKQIQQTPRVFVPDATPARISNQAKKDILNLLARLSQKNLGAEEIVSETNGIYRSTGGQYEPMLAGGLVLINNGRISEAYELLEQLRMENPDKLAVQQAVIWIHFYKKQYKLGSAKILAMLQNVRRPEKSGEPFNEFDLLRFEWAGRLREFVDSVDWTERVPESEDLARIDSLIQGLGTEPLQKYNTGRKHSALIISQFQETLKKDPKSLVRLERQRINKYVPSIANQTIVEEIRSGLDR